MHHPDGRLEGPWLKSVLPILLISRFPQYHTLISRLTYTDSPFSTGFLRYAKIDRALAMDFDLDEEELDFIINYDIKHRMGLGGAEAGE